MSSSTSGGYILASSMSNKSQRNQITSTTSTTSDAAEPAPASPAPTTMTTTTMKRTFFRRPLPSSCTALSSKEGQAMFKSAMAHGGTKSFFHLIEQFSTQSEPAYCGPSTLVIVLNALSVDPRQTWKGPWRWYQEDMLNCCIDMEQVKETGITLGIFVCLAKCQGLNARQSLASDSSVEQFRADVQVACVENNNNNNNDHHPSKQTFLVVSYLRTALGQTGSGHFSPIAAYDPPSDSVLILDTARFKYGPHWVPLPTLFHAMVPTDPDTGRSRGYAMLSYDGDDTMQADRPPLSILFQLKHLEHPLRHQYKDYITTTTTTRNEEITFEDVVSYWTQHGTNYNLVWNIMEGALIPLNDSELDEVEKTRALLRDLVLRHIRRFKQNFRDVQPTNLEQGNLQTCVSPNIYNNNKDNDDQVVIVDGFQIPVNNNPPATGLDSTNLESHMGCSFNAHRQINVTVGEAIFILYLSSLEEPDKRRAIVFENLDDDDDDLRRAGEQILAEAALVQYAIDMSSGEEY